jgi:phosphatidylethanolamine-binding protein (PEBP) family uncharacterized protein
MGSKIQFLTEVVSDLQDLVTITDAKIAATNKVLKIRNDFGKKLYLASHPPNKADPVEGSVEKIIKE